MRKITLIHSLGRECRISKYLPKRIRANTLAKWLSSALGRGTPLIEEARELVGADEIIVGGRSYGVDNVTNRAVSSEISYAASPNGVRAYLVVDAARKHHDASVGKLLENLFNDVDAVAVGQSKVHENDVWSITSNEIERVSYVSRDVDEFEVTLFRD